MKKILNYFGINYCNNTREKKMAHHPKSRVRDENSCSKRENDQLLKRALALCTKF